jgi:hypothetical protein
MDFLSGHADQDLMLVQTIYIIMGCILNTQVNAILAGYLNERFATLKFGYY